MYIGTLSEILIESYIEDITLLLEGKNRQKPGKPLKSFTFDGTLGDYLDQVKHKVSKKAYAKIVKGMETNLAAVGMKNVKLDDLRSQSAGSLGLAYQPKTNLIVANKAMNPTTKAIKDDGSIDTDSRGYKHEYQHKNQFDYARSLADRGNLKQKKKIAKAMTANYADMGKVLAGDKKERDKYLADPLEFDANAAAARGENSIGKGTQRAVQTKLGLTNRPLNPTPKRGAIMNSQIIQDDNTRNATIKNIKKYGLDQPSSSTRQVDEEDLPPAIKEKINKQREQIKAQKEQLQNQQQQIQQSTQPQVKQTPNVQQSAVQTGTLKQVVQPQQQQIQSQPVQQQVIRPQPQRTFQNVQQKAQDLKQTNQAFKSRFKSSDSATDGKTGITYAKVNGKLVSNAMQQRPIQQPQQQVVQQPAQQQVVRPQPQVVQQQPVQQVQPQQQVVQQQPVQQVTQPQKVIIRPAVNQVVKRVKPQTIVNQ